MSKAKFTKGEWFIEKDANWNDDCWAISVKRDYDDSIHHCFAEVVHKMEHEESNDELEANAYLIAKSPKMYKKLEEISNYFGGLDSSFGVDMQNEIDELLREARGEL